MILKNMDRKKKYKKVIKTLKNWWDNIRHINDLKTEKRKSEMERKKDRIKRK